MIHHDKIKINDIIFVNHRIGNKKGSYTKFETDYVFHYQLLYKLSGEAIITFDRKQVTEKAVNPEQIEDLLFANKIVKHSKSNAIVLAKGKQLCASGIGQTSRVDALKQAIEKAKSFGFDLNGAVMASDAFFPFPDCVEIASKAGVNAVVHPGGSIRDNESIEFCNINGIAMVTTGFRHFKH